MRLNEAATRRVVSGEKEAAAKRNAAGKVMPSQHHAHTLNCSSKCDARQQRLMLRRRGQQSTQIRLLTRAPASFDDILGALSVI